MLWSVIYKDIEYKNGKDVIAMMDLYEEKQVINAMETKLKELGDSL